MKTQQLPNTSTHQLTNSKTQKLINSRTYKFIISIINELTNSPVQKLKMLLFTLQTNSDFRSILAKILVKK